MSLVDNLEFDVIDYTGEKCFQVLAEYINGNICNIFVKRIDTTDSNSGWDENLHIFAHDHNGNTQKIKIGKSPKRALKSLLNVEFSVPFCLMKSVKNMNDAWYKSYNRFPRNHHYIHHINREHFNSLFNTDIVNLPSSMFAIGMKDGGAYQYHDNNGGYDWSYEINYTIDYIIYAAYDKTPGKTPRDFYCILCALDGYIEACYPSERNIPKQVGEDEYIKQALIYVSPNEPNVYPVFHKQKYILAQSVHPDTAYTIAVPDRYYFQLNQYNLYRSIHRGIPFKNKISKIVYAGNDRGNKYNFTKRRDIEVSQRAYFKSDSVPKENIHAPHHIERDNMINYKYILDIDGNASTWDATAWKLNSGSVIFKADSNWEQWFYKEYKPWVHYVPIADDFSDIQERYKWCEENPEKCLEMIRNAKELFQTIYRHDNVLKYVNDLLDMLIDEQSRNYRDVELWKEHPKYTKKMMSTIGRTAGPYVFNTYCCWTIEYCPNNKNRKFQCWGDPHKLPQSVFVDVRSFKFFYHNIYNTIPKNHKYILIIGNEDYTIPINIDVRWGKYEMIHSYMWDDIINNEQILHVFATHLTINANSKCSPLPVGFNPVEHIDNDIDTLLLKDVNLNIMNKDIKICMCCRTREWESAQWDERLHVRNLCLTSSWNAFSVCGNIDINHFFDKIQSYSFLMCVHGGGMEPNPKAFCAIYCGTIPIMKRFINCEILYDDLPVVFVEDWKEEYITLEKLEKWREDLKEYFYDTTKREKVLEKLTSKYWWDYVQKRSYTQKN